MTIEQITALVNAGFTKDDILAMTVQEQEQQKGLSTDNFVLMQRLAKSIKYEYVLDMNYTILEFE